MCVKSEIILIDYILTVCNWVCAHIYRNGWFLVQALVKKHRKCSGSRGLPRYLTRYLTPKFSHRALQWADDLLRPVPFPRPYAPAIDSSCIWVREGKIPLYFHQYDWKYPCIPQDMYVLTSVSLSLELLLMEGLDTSHGLSLSLQMLWHGFS